MTEKVIPLSKGKHTNHKKRAWETIKEHLQNNFHKGDEFSKSELAKELDYKINWFLNKRIEELIEHNVLERSFNKEKGHTIYKYK